METLLFLACLLAICAVVVWTVKNDKPKIPLSVKAKVPNAAAREKAPARSRLFPHG